MTKSFYLNLYNKEMLANQLVLRDEEIIKLKSRITFLNMKIKRLKVNKIKE